MRKSKKMYKRWRYIYDNRLNDTGKYFADWIEIIVAYLLLLNLRLFKHEKLWTAVILLILIFILILFIYAVAFAVMGFNLFMEKIGLEEIVEWEARIFIFIFEEGLFADSVVKNN